ncbi:hypothetical protein F7Q99_20655 [Streptomyces kaniharaensis]|uniref:Uncharacterized protein n=1 Tax=Streptomyces kaniharaensis TaxID=212423 RepID=A0A6N7KT47_9ACTN|nr:hypothetical protein [Streptomyces kaniharaensis]MQS14611.1 hypothetical protein [Streptomyces kaniharaensis]
MSWKPLRVLTPRSILPALAVMLVLAAGAAAHANKPVPFGDRVAGPGDAEATPVNSQSLNAADLDLKVGPGLEAYHKQSGEQAWSYRREGATALYLAMAGENAIVLWDDGLVTSVRPGDHEVRWHRAVPGLADWLRSDGEPGAEKRTEEQRRQLAQARAAAALHTVQKNSPWVAVVTPNLTMGLRDADGDLRYNSKPPGSCVYDPLRTVGTDYAVLIPRSCPGSNGQPVSGGISGYRLDSTGWQLNAGPAVQIKAVDGSRVLITDGPIVPPKVFDTKAAAPEVACGSPAAPFAAVRPRGACADPGTTPTADATPTPAPPADQPTVQPSAPATDQPSAQSTDQPQ